MIRTALEYHAPATLDEACQILTAGGDGAAVLAGGTWLVPALTRGERDLTDVVDLRRVGLVGVREDGDDVVVGARTTYAGLLGSDLVRQRLPLLWTAASGITGGAQVRNVGTIGGSACQATPSSDMPAVLVALGAQMRIHGPDGRREVAATEFFVGPFTTALDRGELLAEMALPAAGAAAGYYKLKLAESSWPIATGAALVGASSASITLGAVEATPLRLEFELDGDGRLALSDAELDALVAGRIAEPWDDVLAPASYRRQVAAPVARRALTTALEARNR